MVASCAASAVADGETAPHPRTCNRLMARPEPSRFRRPAREGVTIRARWLSALALCPAPSPARRPAPPAIRAAGRRSDQRRRPNPMYPKRASTSRMIRMITMSDMSGSSLNSRSAGKWRGISARPGLPRVKTPVAVGAQTRGAGNADASHRQPEQRSEREDLTTPPLGSQRGVACVTCVGYGRGCGGSDADSGRPGTVRRSTGSYRQPKGGVGRERPRRTSQTSGSRRSSQWRRGVAGLPIGARGFEPPTARPPAGCATRLRHAPKDRVYREPTVALGGHE